MRYIVRMQEKRPWSETKARIQENMSWIKENELDSETR